MHQVPSNVFHPRLKTLRTSLLTAAFCLISSITIAQNADPPNYFDPARFEADIRAFEHVDSTKGWAANSSIFYGSSSIRLWHDSLTSDMDPLPVIPRGFGGSTMIDAIKYAGRVVIPLRPRAIVLYEGDNDIGVFDIPPSRVSGLFQDFAEGIHKALPKTEIFFLSIKPSPSRWDHWPEMREANRLIRTFCDDDSLLHYVDVATAMLDRDGMPRKEIFLDDMLHMNAKGYAIWRKIVRSALGIDS